MGKKQHLRQQKIATRSQAKMSRPLCQTLTTNEVIKVSLRGTWIFWPKKEVHDIFGILVIFLLVAVIAMGLRRLGRFFKTMLDRLAA